MIRKLRGGRQGLVIVIFAIVLLLLNGCGGSDLTYKKLSQPQQDQLSEQLSRHTGIFEAHGVKIQSSYGTDEGVFVEVRQSQSPWEGLSEAETERLKQDLFEAVGYSFDLTIKSFVLPKQADFTGTITALDGDRVLVVGPAEAGSNPNATWVKLPSGMTDELRIGYAINVWSDGMVEESYPSQTSGLQLQVICFDVGDGQYNGVITAVYLDDPNVENRSIEVDNAKFRLLPFTKFLVDGEAVAPSDLKVGDQVQIWTLGYELMTDVSFATQINKSVSQ